MSSFRLPLKLFDYNIICLYFDEAVHTVLCLFTPNMRITVWCHLEMYVPILEGECTLVNLRHYFSSSSSVQRTFSFPL